MFTGGGPAITLRLRHVPSILRALCRSSGVTVAIAHAYYYYCYVLSGARVQGRDRTSPLTLTALMLQERHKNPELIKLFAVAGGREDLLRNTVNEEVPPRFWFFLARQEEFCTAQSGCEGRDQESPHKGNSDVTKRCYSMNTSFGPEFQSGSLNLKKPC